MIATTLMLTVHHFITQIRSELVCVLIVILFEFLTRPCTYSPRGNSRKKMSDMDGDDPGENMDTQESSSAAVQGFSK